MKRAEYDIERALLEGVLGMHCQHLFKDFGVGAIRGLARTIADVLSKSLLLSFQSARYQPVGGLSKQEADKLLQPSKRRLKIKTKRPMF